MCRHNVSFNTRFTDLVPKEWKVLESYCRSKGVKLLPSICRGHFTTFLPLDGKSILYQPTDGFLELFFNNLIGHVGICQLYNYGQIKSFPRPAVPERWSAEPWGSVERPQGFRKKYYPTFRDRRCSLAPTCLRTREGQGVRAE